MERAELIAIILFTHERQDLYVNLKTTMTGKGTKKKGQQRAAANVQHAKAPQMCPSNNYASWKDSYQRREGK